MFKGYLVSIKRSCFKINKSVNAMSAWLQTSRVKKAAGRGQQRTLVTDTEVDCGKEEEVCFHLDEDVLTNITIILYWALVYCLYLTVYISILKLTSYKMHKWSGSYLSHLSLSHCLLFFINPDVKEVLWVSPGTSHWSTHICPDTYTATSPSKHIII